MPKKIVNGRHYKSTDRSDRVCEHPGCQTRIKARLLAEEEAGARNKVRLCWKHWYQRKVDARSDSAKKALS